MSRFWSPVVQTPVALCAGRAAEAAGRHRQAQHQRESLSAVAACAGGDRRSCGTVCASIPIRGRPCCARRSPRVTALRRKRCSSATARMRSWPTPSRRCSSMMRRCCFPTSPTASIRSIAGFMAFVTRRCRSTPRCGCGLPTTAGRAARSSCPIRMRPPASALPRQAIEALLCRTSGPAGRPRRGLCRFRRRERGAAGRAPRQSAGGADPVQVAGAGRACASASPSASGR